MNYNRKEPFLLKLLRKTKIFYVKTGLTQKFVNYFEQDTNDFLYENISKAFNSYKGYMITRFGTTELENYCCFKSLHHKNLFKDFWYAMQNLKNYNPAYIFPNLGYLSGFFPNDIVLGDKWYELVNNDIKEIDILCSYLKLEKYLSDELNGIPKIDFYGFLCPFLNKNPWTRFLKNKKVLVIYPFKESIESQYKKRENLFSNPDVLPEFKKLTVIKAVQTIADNKSEFKDWFDALHYMENEIDKADFDVALIGCGAYGMDLAAYCKRKGKIGIHMASYVQVLFGIYGTRWENDPIVKPYINEYWARPLETEKPENYKKVEKGCYW